MNWITLLTFKYDKWSKVKSSITYNKTIISFTHLHLHIIQALVKANSENVSVKENPAISLEQYVLNLKRSKSLCGINKIYSKSKLNITTPKLNTHTKETFYESSLCFFLLESRQYPWKIPAVQKQYSVNLDATRIHLRIDNFLIIF